MTYIEPARTRTRRILRILFAGLLAASAATGATLGYQLLASSPSTAATPIEAVRVEPRRELVPDREPGPPPARRTERRGARDGRIDHGAPVAEADDGVAGGTTVFDNEVPGVANLDPALRRALRRAATDAADDGVEFFVNSGWRSREYQERLLHDAVSKYGSEREAARWVATPNTSAHVSGDAVDLGFAAAAWLSRRGAEYGLCQIYRNELWHYELRPEAVDHGCPPMYDDPTRDPRMQQ